MPLGSDSLWSSTRTSPRRHPVQPKPIPARLNIVAIRNELLGALHRHPERRVTCVSLCGCKVSCFRLMFYYLAWMVGKMLTHHLAGINMLTHKASMDRDDLLSIPTQKLRERPPKILFEDLHGSSMVISTTRLPQTSIALRSRFQDFLRQSQSALE